MTRYGVELSVPARCCCQHYMSRINEWLPEGHRWEFCKVSDKKTFKNPNRSIMFDRNGWDSLAWSDLPFSNTEWDMEVTFTRKFKPGHFRDVSMNKSGTNVVWFGTPPSDALRWRRVNVTDAE